MDPTMQLLLRVKKGDEDARNTLVEENLGLVHFIVRRFMGRGYEAEDLFQIGSIGLLKAIDQFDTAYEVKFSTYAVPLITGEIKRFLRDDGMIKVSRSLKEKGYHISRAAERIAAREGREATMHELETETGLCREEIAMALEANVEIESLYKTVHRADGSEAYLVDRIVGGDGLGRTAGEGLDREKERVIERMLLKELMGRLEDEEKEIIRLRFFEEKTQTRVAQQLGMTQVQICRKEKRILRKLREMIRER